MDNIDKRGGFWNLLITLLAATGSIVLAVVTHSVTSYGIAAFMVLGFVVALVSLIHMALREREQLEARELEEIQSGATNEALFEEGEVLPAKRSREQFEKWGMPVVSIVMLVLAVLGIYYITTNRLNVAYDTLDSWMVQGKYIALFGAALMGLVLFLRGQFASNLSRMEKQRFLQAGSDYVLFGAYLNFLYAAVVAIAFKDASVDVYVGTGLVILLGIAAVENLLSMIFEIYRPRVAGRQSRLLYQSRLIGLIAKPENLFTTAGQILDYQFGFKVSETWGYQFLRERLGVVVGLQIILLWLSTTVVVIEPSVRGKLLDGGKEPKLLDPGIHVKLPWPFASVERFDPDRIHTFYVGLEPLVEGVRPARPKTWLEPTGKDYDSKKKTGELFFLTGSGDATVEANLMVVSVPVQYRIRSSSKDGQQKSLKDGWMTFSGKELKDSQGKAMGITHAEQLLRNIAHREVTEYLLTHDFKTLMLEGREQAQADLRAKIQKRAEGLGVDILFVGLADLRPPAESPENIREREDPGPGGDQGPKLNAMPVAAAFENELLAIASGRLDKFSALEESKRLAAEQKSAEVVLEYGANAKASLQVEQAKARAGRIHGAEQPFHQAPKVYPLWLYLTTFERAVEHARKFVVATEHHELEVDLDLHEAIRRGMTDIKVPPKK